MGYTSDIYDCFFQGVTCNVLVICIVVTSEKKYKFPTPPEFEDEIDSYISTSIGCHVRKKNEENI